MVVLAENNPTKEPARINHELNFNFVLHNSPMTFFGAGFSGPLSRCPDVKYNHPFQKPTSVVLTRNGSFPRTDQFCSKNQKLRVETNIVAHRHP